MKLVGFVAMLIVAQPQLVERDIALYGRILIGEVISGQPQNGHETKALCEQWKSAYQVNRMPNERYLYYPLGEIAEMDGALVCVPVVEKKL